jgi:hypothetical protein
MLEGFPLAKAKQRNFYISLIYKGYFYILAIYLARAKHPATGQAWLQQQNNKG